MVAKKDALRPALAVLILAIAASLGCATGDDRSQRQPASVNGAGAEPDEAPAEPEHEGESEVPCATTGDIEWGESAHSTAAREIVIVNNSDRTVHAEYASFLDLFNAPSGHSGIAPNGKAYAWNYGAVPAHGSLRLASFLGHIWGVRDDGCPSANVLEGVASVASFPVTPEDPPALIAVVRLGAVSAGPGSETFTYDGRCGCRAD